VSLATSDRVKSFSLQCTGSDAEGKQIWNLRRTVSWFLWWHCVQSVHVSQSMSPLLSVAAVICSVVKLLSAIEGQLVMSRVLIDDNSESLDSVLSLIVLVVNRFSVVRSWLSEDPVVITVIPIGIFALSVDTVVIIPLVVRSSCGVDPVVSDSSVVRSLPTVD
jgi:hypothetical protein